MTQDQTGMLPRKTSPWKKWALAGGLAAALAGTAGVGMAISDDTRQGFSMGRHAEGGMMQAHWGGHRGGHGGFGGHRLERALDEIDATDEQTDKLWEIAGSVHAQMWPMARGFHEAREELIELLSAETIDPQAVEKLRSERIAAIDEASRTLTEALVEAAEVLTPDQRKQLVELFEERRSHRRW